MKCENCSHAEMCKWIDELEGRGCDFIDGRKAPTGKPMCDRNICISNEYNGIGCDKCIVNKAEQEPNDTVSRGVFEQVMWERDIAIDQLHELGYELGQKIEPCTDAVSRRDAYGCLTFNGHYDTLNEVYERLSKLPSVNPQPCDAISREDRLVDLANAIENDDSGYWTNKKISSALRNIEKLPLVTPSCDKCAMNGSVSKYCDNCKQKSGKWIKEDTDWLFFKARDYRCSECGNTLDFDGVNVGRGDANFCPNCGARMVEPQESEE